MHHNAPDDYVDLEAANERLAKMGVPPTEEGQPEQFRDLTPPRTRKRRSDGGLRRPCAGPPTTPESAPALTITEVTAPDTIALTFHLPAGESFGLLQYFTQSGRADESAYIARQIALFHAAL
jgi:hypothetical protein